MPRPNRLAGFLLLVALLAGCGKAPDATPPEAPGLHNVHRVTANLYSGSGPEGEAGFRSLAALGVKTVISVDGARPDVEAARAFGLHYVHLPIGYDGVPREQALRLAKAVRDLPGPLYLHCHHGKHRGPAAAAVVRRFLEGCSAEDAVAWMKEAGTDARYVGLYAAARDLKRPTREELDRVPGDFPEVAEPTAAAAFMVRIDQHWDHLKAVRTAGWRPPPDHPDIDPPHEARLLAEQYREMARLPEVAARPAGFRRLLTEAEEGAFALEKTLAAKEPAAAVFARAAAACTRCHASYRDVPPVRQ